MSRSCRSLVRLVLSAACVWSSLAGLSASPARAAQKGELEIRAVDAETGEPVAVRMHLRDAKGKPVKPPKTPYWHDHFVFGGKIVLQLPLGNYTFDMERGPEYRERSGYFTIERNASDSKTVEMNRFVTMKDEGWWSGDLHIHRSPEDIEQLMLAEDLHVGPVITWWNEKNPWEDKPLPEKPVVEFGTSRLYSLTAGEDERGGGALLFFNLKAPLPITDAKREYPSSLDYLKLAKRDPDAHVDAEKPFWWDLPVWIASRRLDTIGVANNHLQRDGMMTNEAWGKPREKILYPNPHGNGRWSQDIYFHVLNCGLRIPPSAGSASGVLPNPVGYNRVYVHCDGDLTWEKWWEGLRAGRSVVTNGPMLRPRVNGELPGHVFTAPVGESIELTVALNLGMREKVEYLEVLQDGKAVHEVRLDDFAKRGGELPPVKFDRSGWLAVRAVTNNPKTFRFALTAPYYVEIGQTPRISRRSAQFFLDWVDERMKLIKLDAPEEQEAVLRYHRAARDFWQQKVQAANAD